MKIVHVVRQYAPSVGGLESVVAQLAVEQQQRLGHDVRVVTLDRLFSEAGRRLTQQETIDGIPVTRLRWRGSSRYPLCFSVLRAIRGADLVHVHGIDFFFDYLAATRMLHRIPMVASTHGGFFHTAFASTLKRLWFHTITRLSATAYRRVVATSDNDGAVFARIAASRVAVVENGVDVDRYRDAASADDRPALIYFGRWSINKGLPALIAVLAAMRRLDAAWTLTIAGRPYDLDLAALTALADQHSVASAVELHESPSDAALRALMGRASYFVCLSRHEGFGIAAVEAMSAGLVPLLSDIPPFRKIVEASGSGTLLPVDDPSAAASAVVALRAQRLASNDRRTMIAFTERYEWPLVAKRYDAIYRSALARAASTQPAPDR